MNALRLAAGLLVLGLATVVAAEEKKDDKKDDKKASVVGSWTAAKADAGTIPEGSVVEFTKDGKFTMTPKGAEDKKLEGTYKHEGDKLNLTMKRDGQERTQNLTVKKLTDADLVLTGQDGKSVEFKVKK